MHISRATQIILLIAAMQAVSAYKTRCWFFCTEQTAIQNDYTDDRDRCREYSQLRIDTDTSNPELLEASARKAKLVSLFSSCMGDKGWTVPDGKGSAGAAVPVTTKPPAPPAPAPAPAPAPKPAPDAAALAAAQRNKAFLSRATECAFARHSAGLSTVATARARACDIECEERMKAAPDAPRPAACPADPKTLDLNNGLNVK